MYRGQEIFIQIFSQYHTATAEPVLIVYDLQK